MCPLGKMAVVYFAKEQWWSTPGFITSGRMRRDWFCKCRQASIMLFCIEFPRHGRERMNN
jgi:hypothetical protein